jgi:hypothetical protein
MFIFYLIAASASTKWPKDGKIPIDFAEVLKLADKHVSGTCAF